MIPCEVIKRYNNNVIGATINAPNKAVADSLVASGLVKIIEPVKEKKVAAAPRDKAVKESTDK